MTKYKKALVQRNHRRRGLRRDLPDERLTWWRTIRAESFSSAAAVALRRAMANIAILGEPTWHEAAKGDAAAAVRLALRLHSGTSPMIYDLVMTAVAACAADDNATACLIMPEALRQTPGAGRTEARLATSWLVRSLKNAAHKNVGGFG